MPSPWNWEQPSLPLFDIRILGGIHAGTFTGCLGFDARPRRHDPVRGPDGLPGQPGRDPALARLCFCALGGQHRTWFVHGLHLPYHTDARRGAHARHRGDDRLVPGRRKHWGHVPALGIGQAFVRFGAGAMPLLVLATVAVNLLVILLFLARPVKAFQAT